MEVSSGSWVASTTFLGCWKEQETGISSTSSEQAMLMEQLQMRRVNSKTLFLRIGQEVGVSLPFRIRDADHVKGFRR